MSDVTIQIAAIHPRMGTAEMPWPERKSEWAAGYDVCAAIDEPLELWPGRLVKVPLGFALGMPEGWEAQVRPRSGLAARGLIMPNSPGTVDADYRGEVSALLYMLPLSPYRDGKPDQHVPLGQTRMWTIESGDRIAQIVFARCAEVKFSRCTLDLLSQTKRGAGGFGSTG